MVPQQKYMDLEQMLRVLTKYSEECEFVLQHYELGNTIFSDYNWYQLEDNADLLYRLQNVNYKNPDFLKLVSQFEQALKDPSPQAQKFIKSLWTIFNAFDVSHDSKTLTKNWASLAKKIKDTKLQYIVISCFIDQNVPESQAKEELLGNNPHANAYQIIWAWRWFKSADPDSPLLERGLKKLANELEQELATSNPNFIYFAHIARLLGLPPDHFAQECTKKSYNQIMRIFKNGIEAITAKTQPKLPINKKQIQK